MSPRRGSGGEPNTCQIGPRCHRVQDRENTRLSPAIAPAMQCLHAGVDDHAHGMSRVAARRQTRCGVFQEEFDAGGDPGSRRAWARGAAPRSTSPAAGHALCHTRLAFAAPRSDIECVGDTERLQWLVGDPRERVAAIRAIAVHAQRRKRNFFMYSTRPDDAAVARRLGLVATPGYMMALAPEARHEPTVRGWAAMSWHVHSGDRM